jgi:hypothetical protein
VRTLEVAVASGVVEETADSSSKRFSIDQTSFIGGRARACSESTLQR